jgi:hypothetical protein
MSPSKARAAIVLRLSRMIDEMAGGVAALPLDSVETFLGDDRNVAAAESYLRKSLEAGSTSGVTFSRRPLAVTSSSTTR